MHHKTDGNYCRVMTKRKEMRLRGLAAVEHHWQGVLKEVDIPFKVDLGKYAPANDGEPSEAGLSCYVEPWVALLLKVSKLDPISRLNALKQGNDDPEFRKAIEVSKALGGTRALRTLVEGDRP